MRIVVAGGMAWMCRAVLQSMTQSAPLLPFAAGERLTYWVAASFAGAAGQAVMSVDATDSVRGAPALRATFDTHIRVLLATGTRTSRSWIDPRRLASLRFVSHEHRPFSTTNDTVEIYPDRRRWTDSRGDSGTTASGEPLDELSFIYFLRTIALAPDSVYTFDRFYDQRRNPTTVRVIRRDTLHTPAGTFVTQELEMLVKDAHDYHGTGVLHLWLSEDRCRLPVRIESVLPLLGHGVMTLESAVTPGCTIGATPSPRSGAADT